MTTPKDDLDIGKVKEGFEKSKTEAELVVQDPDKTRAVLEKALDKARKVKGPLEKVWENLQMMIGLVKDWLTGNYREVPRSTIVMIVAALLYLISPIDVIPDFIPIIGYLDDVFVIGLVINRIFKDLEKYKEWKERQEGS